MKTHYIFLSVLLSMLMTTGCQWTSKPTAPELTFHNECLSPLPAPPRNQGQAESCWGYSMTARLENLLMQRSDTIALSPGSSHGKPTKKLPSAPGRTRPARFLSVEWDIPFYHWPDAMASFHKTNIPAARMPD